jgi:plastocyanin
MRYPKRPLAFPAAVLLATLAACGPGTSTAGPPAPAVPPATGPSSMPGMAASPSGSQAPVTSNTVAIRNFAFAPATVAVPVGTTVTWTNDDQDAHTVTATGQTFSFTFTRPGRYDYLCTIHPFMTATVVVTP